MNKTLSTLLCLSFSLPLCAEEAIDTLSPLTVTATRTEQDTNLVSETIITRADIERLQINTVEQALRGLAGINISNSGGLGKQTSLFLRGTNSSQVLVLVDGIRMGSVTAGTTSFEYLPIREIDYIEVIRGPKSSLYGSEAIGGIIHIHTRRGADKPLKPTLSFGTGSHDRYVYSGGIDGSLDDAWYNLNISHELTHGFDATTGGLTPDDDGFRNSSGSARFGYQISDDLLVEGNALYAAGRNEYDISPTAWGAGDEFAENKFIQQAVGGQVKYKAADFWNMTFKAGQSRDRYKDINTLWPGNIDNQRFSLTAQNDFTLAKGQVLTLGYDYLADSVLSTLAYSQTERDNHAVFTQYQADYENHQLITGYRHDENQQFGGHDTWNVGYGYRFANQITPFASYGTAYKAPTFNDVFAPLAWGSNPNLQPEKSQSYEVGVKGQHDWGYWSITHYANFIEDLIVADTQWTLQNISQARIRGIELIGGTQLFGLDVQANLSLMNPENREYGPNAGKLLPRRAEEVFRLDVDKRFEDFSLGTSFLAEGRRFDDAANTIRLDGFTTLDFRAEYRLLNQLTLQAKINNVLNQPYQTVYGYNTDDLNLFFGLRYTPDI